MASRKLTKQEYTRIGTFSTAVVVGTACDVLFTASTGIPITLVIAKILASVAGGILATEALDLSRRWAQDNHNLRNNDLTRIVGKAIASVIISVADSPDYPKDVANSLRKMAKVAEEKWENIVENLPDEFAPIDETQLTDFFSDRPEDFSNLTTLDVDLWAALLDCLRGKAGVLVTKPVISDTANYLHEIFSKALREELKKDFQADGKAFAGMVLDLFAVLRSEIASHHGTILQKLDEIKLQNPSAIPPDFNLAEFEQRLELLSRKNQEEIATELKNFAGEIKSDLQEIRQQSQQQYEELRKAIAHIADPQAVQNKFWQILRSKAQDRPNWLQFLTAGEMATRKLIPPTPPKNIRPRIPINQSLYMVIDLDFKNHQLLLFNRSQQEQCLLCPSSAYAPNPIIEESPLVLPQEDAWADEDKQFIFDKLGKEEFIAILLEQPLNLPWLIPPSDEGLIEWNNLRIKELFAQLRQQSNWQVFYQNFQVIEH